jgi:hypothetical protein
MTAFDLVLSDGTTLTTIQPQSIDNRRSTSLVLIGQGVRSNWQTIDQNLVWLLENFSKGSPPPNPLVGQKWFDPSHDRMNVYTASGWQPIVSASAAYDVMFDMSVVATNIDFTIQQAVPIFTATDPTKVYCPTSVLLVPSGEITASTSPTVNVSVLTAGDVAPSQQIEPETGQSVRLSMSTACRQVSASLTAPDSLYGRGHYGSGPYGLVEGSLSTVFLNITTPATGGTLRYDAFIYGAFFPAPPQSLYGIGGYGLGPYGRGAE